MKTAIAPTIEFNSPSEAELKDLFDRSFELIHQDLDTSSWFDPDVAVGDIPELPALPSDYEVAQVMLERKVAYWQHAGWLDACKTAIHMMVYGKEFAKVQAICQWLLKEPPKGVALLSKDLVGYAAGDFPVEDVNKQNERLDYFTGRIKANRSGQYKPNPVPIWRQLETEVG